MNDRKEFRKRMALRVLSKPRSLYPFSGGLSLILVQWGLDLMLPMLNFIGFAGIIIGLASLVMNFVDLDDTAEEVYEEMNTSEKNNKEQALEELEKALIEDSDPRTQELFNDLRNIFNKFVEIASDGSTNAESAQSIMNKIHMIFETCILKFNRTLVLNTQSASASKTLKRKILTERESIIKEIIDSIAILNDIVFNFDKYQATEEAPGNLAKMSKELQQELEIAKKADSWTKEMLNETNDRDRE
ncbi:hypothetical protein KAJ27_01710 [bacterium]|nr:hypothetical protein [bacterium]